MLYVLQLYLRFKIYDSIFLFKSLSDHKGLTYFLNVTVNHLLQELPHHRGRGTLNVSFQTHGDTQHTVQVNSH